MAEEFVRKEHFEEFVKRVDERFLGVEKRMEQGFAHAEKAREQNLVHLNQRFEQVDKRFDSLERRMDQGFAQVHLDVSQMRNWLVRLYALVVFGFVGAIALILFKDLFFSSS